MIYNSKDGSLYILCFYSQNKHFGKTKFIKHHDV